MRCRSAWIESGSERLLGETAEAAESAADAAGASPATGDPAGEDDVAAECRPAAKPRRPPTANPANKESGGAAGAWRECDGDMLGIPMQNSSLAW
mmetsp:Transcript_45218/g.145485  ORF Transcript_45218/g.145485 Transcript_45218/m.145485 type:complete len:95 (-) Transcript_45218:3-287(-)